MQQDNQVTFTEPPVHTVCVLLDDVNFIAQYIYNKMQHNVIYIKNIIQ